MNVKVNIVSLLIASAVISCNNDTKTQDEQAPTADTSATVNTPALPQIDTTLYAPSLQMDSAQQHNFLYSIVRYVAPLPKKASEKTKFESRFDEAYHYTVEKLKLEAYHQTPEGDVYFLVSRIAPSIEVKRVATGGKLKYDSKKNITEYSEIFRTWKMKLPELKVKSLFLFQEMINNKDLTQYYTATTGDSNHYIEFPDEHNTYDVQNRIWVTK